MQKLYENGNESGVGSWILDIDFGGTLCEPFLRCSWALIRAIRLTLEANFFCEPGLAFWLPKIA